jgi:hypothetical protein
LTHARRVLAVALVVLAVAGYFASNWITELQF